jgi:hypothetical protein
MVATGYPATSETNYQFTQRKIPHRRKPEIKLCIAILFHETQIRYENSEFGDIYYS